MINKSQKDSETAVENNLVEKIEFLDKNNYFEPIKVNLPSYDDADDPNISSLFGDKNFNNINSFVYENEQKSNTKLQSISKLFSTFNAKKIFNKKVAIAAFAATVLIGGFSIGNIFETNNFNADASPLSKIENQNISSKTKEIKSQISLGDIYNENYTVKYKLTEGDTIAKISERTSVPTEAIKIINNIKNDSDLSSKESINIPTRDSLVYRITSNDTLGTIAQKYNVSIKDIRNMNKGNIKNPNFLQLDQILFIPFEKNDFRDDNVKTNLQTTKTNDKKVNHKNKAVSLPTSRENNIVHRLASGETLAKLSKRYKISINKIIASNPELKSKKPKLNEPIIIPINDLNRSGGRDRNIRIASRSLMSGVNSEGVRSSGRFLWPAKGEFSSPFGRRGREFHKGIDVAAVVGTPINAAMQGKVVYTGWESGYGQTVEIRHGDNLVTRYAHCSKIFVSVGQVVETGEHIAAIGMTGHVTGPHVHFEVLVNGVQVNPRNYL